jgi:hypothetical protein
MWGRACRVQHFLDPDPIGSRSTRWTLMWGDVQTLSGLKYLLRFIRFVPIQTLTAFLISFMRKYEIISFPYLYRYVSHSMYFIKIELPFIVNQSSIRSVLRDIRSIQTVSKSFGWMYGVGIGFSVVCECELLSTHTLFRRQSVRNRHSPNSNSG